MAREFGRLVLWRLNQVALCGAAVARWLPGFAPLGIASAVARQVAEALCQNGCQGLFTEFVGWGICLFFFAGAIQVEHCKGFASAVASLVPEALGRCAEVVANGFRDGCRGNRQARSPSCSAGCLLKWRLAGELP